MVEQIINKDVNNMTIDEFEALPHLAEWDKEVDCDSLIILPARIPFLSFLLFSIWKTISSFSSLIREPECYEVRGLHDSGFRLLSFVAVIKGKPICRISGCSDVIHFDGIGGYGYRWLERYGKVPETVPPGNWNMDCLAVSGLLRIFGPPKIRCGCSLSSFEIYAIRETDRKDEKQDEK